VRCVNCGREQGAHNPRKDRGICRGFVALSGHVSASAAIVIAATECTCHYDCGEDSHSGGWHQHEGEPCPVHPYAAMVG
jgi:hypothetical protein